MSVRRSRTIAFGRLWARPQEERQAHARTPEERTTACFNEHAPTIRRSLAAVFPARDVDDAVQEAFLKLHAALAGGEEIEQPQAWVFTVARNELIRVVRRTKCQRRIYEGEIELIVTRMMDSGARVTPEQVFMERSRREALGEAVSSLSELERRCLRERIEGRTLADIGRMVNLDLRRVSEIIASVLQELQEKLRGRT